jgi:hypothetical protein
VPPSYSSRRSGRDIGKSFINSEMFERLSRSPALVMQHGHQQIAPAISSIAQNATNPVSKCHRLWVSLHSSCVIPSGLISYQDPVDARFETCALPLIEAIPGLIAILIIIFRLIRLATRRVKGPQWTRAFVTEPRQAKGDLPSGGRTYPSHSNALFFASFIGLIFQIAAISYPRVQTQDVSVISSWVNHFP